MYIVHNEKNVPYWHLCEWARQDMPLVIFALMLCGSKAKTYLILQCAFVSVTRQSESCGMIKV